MSSNYRKLADRVFGFYPEYQEIYITTDGVVFLEKTNAENHALKSESSVLPFKREDIEAEVDLMADKGVNLSTFKREDIEAEAEETINVVKRKKIKKQ